MFRMHLISENTRHARRGVPVNHAKDVTGCEIDVYDRDYNKVTYDPIGDSRVIDPKSGKPFPVLQAVFHFRYARTIPAFRVKRGGNGSK